MSKSGVDMLFNKYISVNVSFTRNLGGLMYLSLLMQFSSSQHCKSTDKDGHCQIFSNVNEEIEVAQTMNNALAVVLYDEESVFPIHQRERTFRYCGKDLVIKQDWSGLGVAAVVWDAVSLKTVD